MLSCQKISYYSGTPNKLATQERSKSLKGANELAKVCGKNRLKLLEARDKNIHLSGEKYYCMLLVEEH